MLWAFPSKEAELLLRKIASSHVIIKTQNYCNKLYADHRSRASFLWPLQSHLEYYTSKFCINENTFVI